jgi:hypothetical protein
MSERTINDITLMYLTNTDFDKKKNIPNVEQKQKPLRKDKKFYKKRVLDLFKRMLQESTSKEPVDMGDYVNIPNDVHTSFNLYMHNCIEYFKCLDKSEILQEEYDALQEKLERQEIECKTQEEADKLFARNIQLKTENKLDNFVVRKPLKKDAMTLPQKRNVKLKDPALKNKGVEKKKNLGTKYEQASQENKGSKEKSPET